MKQFLLPALLAFFCLQHSILTAQTYTSITVDTSVHFNITMEPGMTYYYSTFAGSTGAPAATVLGFVDGNDDPIDFLEIEIDRVLLAGIGGGIFIYAIQFNLQLGSNPPPPGTIDNVSMVSVFLNSSGTIIGGYVRSNMSITVEGTSAVFSADRDARVSVYPNPAADWATIEWSDKQDVERLELWSAQGAKIMDQKTSNNSHQLNLSAYPAGMYYLRLYSGQQMYAHTLVKN
ncbi:MAG: T9SS type A sorting domain-containing protein [Lewinellaceae bacterium]|nr:T9SS type A sorting domain-containing protein [Saprospiraceae bacterium]MCB9331156.1 T9SS type A sorting domain-containing protein [Lewinellaceae bacterium]